MKKLFIYIPTFNRIDSLVEQLNALLPQVAMFPEVRLHINDNASSDIDIQSLRSRIDHERVLITRNGCNIGGNANILLGFVYWREDEALWILSDNDIVRPNAVEQILAAIDSDADLIRMRDSNECGRSIYHWEDGWSSEIRHGTGLISAVIYNTVKFKSHVQTGFLYHNTSFPHLAVILAYASESKLINFLNIEKLISPVGFARDEKTDYSLSQLGMPVLSELMPTDKAIVFCQEWLDEWELVFFAQQYKYPAVFKHSLNYMKQLNSALKLRLDALETRVLDSR
jgi:hypothetical protein